MRPADDHYPTPTEVTRALLSVENFSGTIWEPCAGGGEMANVLRRRCPVLATTLAPNDETDCFGGVGGGVDFLKTDWLAGDNIVTNPPFNISEDIIRHAIKLEPTKISMLLNIRFLGSRKRKEGLFAEYPPKRIWVFCDRPSMYPADWEGKRGTTTETFSWWIWESPFTIQAPEIGWLDSRDFQTNRI